MACLIWQSLITTFGLILAATGAILGFYVFPNIVTKKIADSFQLTNGSDAFERWMNTPTPVFMKIYFFNISNPQDVKNGGAPIVKEIGPYVYNQIKSKVDIAEENDNLTYYQRQLFHFNQNSSGCHREDDVIVVANLPLMSMMAIAEKKSSFVTIIINQHLKSLFGDASDIFIKTTPKDFLFDGIYIYCNKRVGSQNTFNRICKDIKMSAFKQLEELKDGRLKFSFLSFKNKTEEKSYKINSGVKNIKLLGEIIEWNNSTKISAWNDNGTCNNVYGSDSMLFPPYVTENTNITVFQSDICRTVYLDFENRSKYKGLSSIKFVESNMLTSGATFSNNKCFCINETKGILGEDGCLLDGAMELQTCLNTPVVLTFPHFFKAHTKYQNGVLGVNPNKTLHETFVELEPKTGVVLRGAKRVQFNIFYRKIKHAKLTDKLNETLMPVLWIDEGIELEDKYVDRLNEQLFSILMMLDKIEWALIGVGLLVSIIGFMTFFIVVKINLRKSGG